MKVIKINKSYRGGTKQHFLVLLGENSNEDIEYKVVNWCQQDLSGSNYGWVYEWEIIEDKQIINDVLKNKIGLIEVEIEVLRNEKCALEQYLK